LPSVLIFVGMVSVMFCLGGLVAIVELWLVRRKLKQRGEAFEHGECELQ